MGLTSNISRATCSLTFILMATACASTRAIRGWPTRQAASTADEWAAYGHDVYGSRYSPLTDINRDNISRLRVAWTYHTREPLATRDMKRSLEVTPLMIGNTLYLSTPLGKIVALDPVTGTEKWKYDAKVGLHSGFGDFTTRGVSYWNGRIFMATTDGRLIAVDASAGVPIAETNRVVFTGGAPTVTALAGGHVDFAGQQWSESAGLIQGRKIRGLAVVHPTRLPGLADVPTAKEAGFPDLDVVGWQGLAGPPKLPAAVVQKWTALLEEASKDPAFLEQAAKLNKVFAYKGPDAFWQFQQDELKKYLPLATRMGIRK